MRVETSGLNTLYLGDCRELGPIDACRVTDPPYGIDYRSRRICGKPMHWHGKAIEGDADTSIRDRMLIGGHPFACFGSPKTSPPPNTRATLVWDKGPGTGMGDLGLPWKLSFELIWIGGDGWSGRRDEGVLRHAITTSASTGREHPNQKPVSLMEAIIAKAPPGPIFDPFMGVGTTGVACANLGREYIGVEIDERYFDIACERISAASSQLRLFA